MKRITQLIIVVMMTVGLVGCGVIVSRTTTDAQAQPEQSVFKENFSIGTMVEDHQELLVVEAPRTLSGMEAGPRTPFTQSQEYITMQVEQENIAELMTLIQSDIQAAIIDSGAQQVGSGGSSRFDEIGHFSYSYREGPIYRVINIWGFRGEATNFKVIAQITESFEQ